MQVYRQIATYVDAYHRCLANGNALYKDHAGEVEDLVCEHMPSGSGWDCGTTLDIGESTKDKLVFFGSYHHMDEGTYCGWSSWTITVKPSLIQILDISVECVDDCGNDIGGLDDMLFDWFDRALMLE